MSCNAVRITANHNLYFSCHFHVQKLYIDKKNINGNNENCHRYRISPEAKLLPKKKKKKTPIKFAIFLPCSACRSVSTIIFLGEELLYGGYARGSRGKLCFHRDFFFFFFFLFIFCSPLARLLPVRAINTRMLFVSSFKNITSWLETCKALTNTHTHTHVTRITGVYVRFKRIIHGNIVVIIIIIIIVCVCVFTWANTTTTTYLTTIITGRRRSQISYTYVYKK